MIVFVTGAESTGKSTLCEQLSKHFDVPFVSEYARDYVSSLDREYTFQDVEKIAIKQIDQIKAYAEEELVFFDTGLIITYIWFLEKYSAVPAWFRNVLSEYGKGKYLLCLPDIPWEEDPLRENPHKREQLHSKYLLKIKELGFDFEKVEGVGDERFLKAADFVKKWTSK